MQIIRCDTFCESFESFLDGEAGLSWDVFNLHLGACSACREYVYSTLNIQGRMKEFQVKGALLSAGCDTTIFARDLKRPYHRLGAILAASASTVSFVVLAFFVERNLSTSASIRSLAYLGVLATAAILPWASVLVVRHAAFIKKILLMQLVVYGFLPILGSLWSFHFNSDYLLVTMGSFLSYLACDLTIRSLDCSNKVVSGLAHVRSLFIESKKTRWRYRLAMALVVSAPILVTSSIARGVEPLSSPVAYSTANSYTHEVSDLPCNPVARKRLFDSKVYL